MQIEKLTNFRETKKRNVDLRRIGEIHAIRPLIEQLLENNYRLSERVIKLVL